MQSRPLTEQEKEFFKPILLGKKILTVFAALFTIVGILVPIGIIYSAYTELNTYEPVERIFMIMSYIIGGIIATAFFNGIGAILRHGRKQYDTENWRVFTGIIKAKSRTYVRRHKGTVYMYNIVDVAIEDGVNTKIVYCDLDAKYECDIDEEVVVIGRVIDKNGYPIKYSYAYPTDYLYRE